MTRRTRLRRSSPPRRLTRATAVAVIGLSTLGLSACQWTSPITTQMQYDPSDGKSVNAGSVQVLNALIVAAAANGPATLFGSLQNTSKQSQTVQIAIGDSSLAPIQVAAGQVIRLGQDVQTVIAKVPAAPGALTEVVFTAGGSAASARIPVLAPQGPYEGLTPTAIPTSTAAPTASASGPGTPAPSPSTASPAG